MFPTVLVAGSTGMSLRLYSHLSFATKLQVFHQQSKFALLVDEQEETEDKEEVEEETQATSGHRFALQCVGESGQAVSTKAEY